MKYKWICKLDKKDCACDKRMDDGFCKEKVDWRCCPYMIPNMFGLEG